MVSMSFQTVCWPSKPGGSGLGFFDQGSACIGPPIVECSFCTNEGGRDCKWATRG
jgi:hypothetical protein